MAVHGARHSSGRLDECSDHTNPAALSLQYVRGLAAPPLWMARPPHFQGGVLLALACAFWRLGEATFHPQPLGGMHGAAHSSVVALGGDGARSLERSVSGIAFFWKGVSICRERPHLHFCATWRNCLVVLAGRAVSDHSILGHWNCFRGRRKRRALVAGAVARRRDYACCSSQAREITL